METIGQGRCFLYLIPSHIFEGYWTNPKERTAAQYHYRTVQIQGIWRTACEGRDEFGLVHPINGIDTFSIHPDEIPDIDFSRRINGVPYIDILSSVLFHGLDHYKLNRNVGKIQFRFIDDPVHQKLRRILEEAASKTNLPINSQPIRSLPQVLADCTTKPI